MNILLLSQYFPPEAGSAAAKMAEIAHYLTEQGHQVSVVSQVPCYPAGVVYPGYEGTWFQREQQNGVHITRTWSYASPERGKFKPRLLNYASFMGTALSGIFAGPRPDVMMVYSPPLLLGVTATLVRKVWRTPFVFWVNDLWPRAALHLGFMQEGSLYRAASALERFVYRHAARIFVYSQRMLEEVVADGGSRDKIEYHPLWIDTEVFHPDPAGADKVRQQYGWGNKFVILYGGNIGLAQGLDVFVEAALLLREHPDVHFVIVGSGVEKENLEKLVQDYGLTNFEFIGQQPKEQVLAYFSAADLLFAHLKEAPHRVGTVPEKILAYMACGRPVLMAAQEGAAADVIREHGCGVTAPPDNPEAVARTVLALLPQCHELDEMGARGRQATELYFAGLKVLEAMEASLSAVSDVKPMLPSKIVPGAAGRSG
jgi:colanic acid biosynthesis glycosyl transferase WcaI